MRIPKFRFRKRKPVKVDMGQFASSEEVERLTEELLVERKAKMKVLLASLSPRQLRKLEVIRKRNKVHR